MTETAPSENSLQVLCKRALSELNEKGLSRRASPGFFPCTDQATEIEQRTASLDSFILAIRQSPAAQADLCTNDYLGLRYNWCFRESSWQAMRDLPSGAGGSRYLGGEHPIHEMLEREISQWQQSEDCILFVGGYQANQAVVQGLMKLKAAIHCDRLCHASTMEALHWGPRLAPLVKILPHLKFPTDCPPHSAYLTEGLFSMDGDFFPVEEWRAHCKQTESALQPLLIVDEAHTTGCLSPRGSGLMDHRATQNLVSVNTFGKALGCSGAAVCGPKWFVEFLRQFCRSHIYATGLSPITCAAILTAIDFTSRMDSLRHRLSDNCAYFRSNLKRLGYQVAGSDRSYIVPILSNHLEETNSLQAFLGRNGILTKVIRPPTVRKGQERLRLSLHALMTRKDMDILLEYFAEFLNRKYRFES